MAEYIVKNAKSDLLKEFIDQRIKNKQDILAFDGEYNFETNPVATVQTVNDAIANADSGGVSSWNDLLDKPFEETAEGVKTLDEKFIPDTIARTATIEAALIEVQTDASNKATVVLAEAQTDASNKAALVLAEAQQYTDTAIANIDIPEGFSGSYNDLTDKPTIPTIPTNVSAFTNDAGYLTEVPSEYVTETELNDAIANIPTGDGSATAIIDVDSLPIENINANAFYRVKGTAYTILDGEKNIVDSLPSTVYIVDALPDNPKPYFDANTMLCSLYLRKHDLILYVYSDEAVSSGTGIPIGWHTATDLGLTYSVVTSPDEATEPGTLYIVYTAGGLFAYNGTEWVEYVTKAQLDEAVANAGLGGASNVGWDTLTETTAMRNGGVLGVQNPDFPNVKSELTADGLKVTSNTDTSTVYSDSGVKKIRANASDPSNPVSYTINFPTKSGVVALDSDFLEYTSALQEYLEVNVKKLYRHYVQIGFEAENKSAVMMFTSYSHIQESASSLETLLPLLCHSDANDTYFAPGVSGALTIASSTNTLILAQVMPSNGLVYLVGVGGTDINDDGATTFTLNNMISFDDIVTEVI